MILSFGQFLLVNPSHVLFGTSVITPRWLYVLAAATPASFGDPELIDQTLSPLDASRIQRGDVVGIGIHTGNALREFEIGRLARQRGAFVFFGGIHATLYPEEAQDLGRAHAVVKGDGDVVWDTVLEDSHRGGTRQVYTGGRIDPSDFVPARWDLVPRNRCMWASVQTVRGCPKHCSFCSVWRTDGQRPRQHATDSEIATDSAWVARSTRWARWLAQPCRYLFSGRPLPELQVPKPFPLLSQLPFSK
jgi:hypothetical protein